MTPPVRLASLTLEKYGPFENRTLTFREGAALHVVYGRNEAGKSMTLRALSDLFCGFPARIDSEDFRTARFRSADLRIGATLVHADGRSLVFRRRSGRSNTLLGATDSEKGDEARFREFAGAPERDEFETEFGLTAEALRRGGKALLDAGGRLAETLAAGSGQLSALNRVRTELEIDAAAYYIANGRSRKLNEALERYRSADKALRESIVTSDALKRARDAFESAEERCKDINERHREIERRRALLERAKRTHQKLRLLSEAVARLNAFAMDAEVDDDTLAAWEKALGRRADLARLVADAQAKLKEIDEAAAAIKLAPELVAGGAEIEQLVGALGAASKSREDLPKREDSARAARGKLEQAAHALGLPDAQVLIERMPNDIALTRGRELLRARAALDLAREGAASRLAKAQARQRALEQSGAARTEDPANIARAFAAFADLPAVATRLRSQASDIDQQGAALARDAQRLLPPISLDDLLCAPLPDIAHIDACIRRSTALADELREINRDAAALAESIDANERALQALAREGAVATLDDLAAARARRDAMVNTIEVEPADAQERAQHFANLRGAIADADQTADILLTGADRAARRQQISDALSQAQAARARLEERRAAHEVSTREADAEWQALWRPCGLSPLAPSQMRDWRTKAGALLERRENLAAVRASQAAAQSEMAERVTRLREVAARIGVESTGREPVADLYALARSVLDGLQKDWDAGRQREADLVAVSNEIADAQSDLLQYDARRLESGESWREAMATLCLREDAGAMEAEDALRIWSEAMADLRAWRDDDHRVLTIRRDIEAFEAKVNEACARFCPELAGEAPRRIVEALTQRLGDARLAKAKREQIEEQRARAQRERDDLLQQHSAVSDVLAGAARSMAVDIEALGEALARAAQRRALMSDIAALRRDIVAAGDGHTPEELEREQESLDIDALAGDLAALEAEGKIILGDIASEAIKVNEARKALEALEAGRDAPARALERREAGADILSTARDWLLRIGAAKLAGVAMEQHRQRNQDPVIALAARLLKQATGGAFAGVVVDLDEDGRPLLKALRPDGARLNVDALSEGARDQLFLALRLALLAQRSADPLPFAGDDLLASFDDERTAHTIEMLSEFGAERQTLLFTHHRYVVDAALARLGERADVIELGA
jgi:chromosome segregation protein